MEVPGLYAVDPNDPAYPIFQAGDEYSAGNVDRAWSLARPKLAEFEKDPLRFDPKLAVWLIERMRLTRGEGDDANWQMLHEGRWLYDQNDPLWSMVPRLPELGDGQRYAVSCSDRGAIYIVNSAAAADLNGAFTAEAWLRLTGDEKDHYHLLGTTVYDERGRWSS